MATVEHSTLTTGELHEPKGIATANANTVYIADGAGSGSWRLRPNGHCSYDNDSGSTFTTPTTYTLINVATTTSGTQREFSHNAAGRLTYTGAMTTGVIITSLVSYDNSAASAELKFQLHVNGSPVGTQSRVSASAANTNNTTVCILQANLNTNDYVELYATCSTGNLRVKALTIDVEGTV